jgi:alkylation response protein AidB-like acyl-CoA dehydrogenase
VSSESRLLEQVTAEIVRDYLASRPADAADEGWAPALWATLADADLPLAGIPEQRGGAGGGWAEVAAVLRASGRYGTPVPLAESCALAGWLLAEAGLRIPEGPLTVAPVRADDRLELTADGNGWRLHGVAGRVPWASQAAGLVVLAGGEAGPAVAVVPPAVCEIEPGANLAGEPRDRVTFAGVKLASEAVAAVTLDPDAVLVRGALVRAIQMVGALDRLLELTVGYVQARTQFGRPLGRFQAVQHDLARLAGECVASSAAVEAAVAAISRGPAVAEVAAAKVRTAEAAALGTRIAHQLHGAIGFTQEHQLHRFTTRLWSWRDEFGGERQWAVRLGRLVAAGGPDPYWDWLTGSARRQDEQD